MLLHAQFRLITAHFFLSRCTEKEEEEEKRHKLIQHDTDVSLNVRISMIVFFLFWKRFQCG